MDPFDEEQMMESRSGRICIRLLIVDDRPRVRQSLEALLTALRWNTPYLIDIPIEIVGKAIRDQQTVEQVQSLQPDVIVMDLPMRDSMREVRTSGPQLDGLATIRMIKSRWPAVRVVVMTMYATERSASLLAGADAFLLKGCPITELLAAVMPEEH